jgi:hypothetical protein
MPGDWKRITFDPRDNPNGYTYHCKEGHSWFLTFREQDQMNIAEVAKNCPHCDPGVQVYDEAVR